MNKTFDGKSYKRVSGSTQEKAPVAGFERKRALFTATGEETSIDLSTLTPAINYYPGRNQISVKRSSGASALISGTDFFEYSSSRINFPPEDPLLPGEVVEVMLEFGVTGVMAIKPRLDAYTEEGKAGQTLVSANFSWQYNANPNRGQGAVLVYLHGALQTRGVDYTEVNLGGTNTNQIQFVDPLIGGENIIMVPSYQALDVSAETNTFLGNQTSNIQAHLSAFQPFVDESEMIAVPGTSIVNRAKIPNIANDLKASFGIDRIMTQSIFELQNEFGASGERVFGATNDDRGLIRFVGSNWRNFIDSNGQFAGSTSSSGDYIEVTFYGTGLNWITILDAYASARDTRVSVDGGAEGSSSVMPASLSLAINARSYSSNQIINVASGLSLGVHTVKIRSNSANGIYCYGFEVLNESSSILVNPGTAYKNGIKYTDPNQSLLAINSGVTGTRGGRSVVYLNADGTIGNAFQAVDTTQKNLANADHSNEEVLRRLRFREFGANRADDFSTLGSTASSRGFTLDNGTTTLVGSSVTAGVSSGIECIGFPTSGTSSITFTFIGTGLDIISVTTVAFSGSIPVTVDGISAGSITSNSPGVRNQKICSGLPFGTHTVKFLVSSVSAGDWMLADLIIYQPKKPSIPASAIELADYNVMANFSSVAAGALTVASGVLRKDNTREATYVNGTGGANWSVASDFSGTNYPAAFYTESNHLGSYVEYTFFGTGFDWKHVTATNQTNNCTVTINGVALNSSYPGANSITVRHSGNGNFAGTLANNSALLSTLSTNVLNKNGAAAAASLSVSGLPIGLYRVRFTQSAAASASTYLTSGAIDIVTPIHSSKYMNAVAQSSLTIGSCAISDSRKTTPVKSESKRKNISRAVGSTISPTTTSTVAVPCPDMSVTHFCETGRVRISWSAVFQNSSAGGYTGGTIYVDGASVSTTKGANHPTANSFVNPSDVIILDLSPGVHKIDLYWNVNAGSTATAFQNWRNITVEDI